MNDTSSRSHAVFSLILTQRRHDVETGMDTEKVSKISLVDLAGSERANSTGAVGARLKEGAEINRSLSTLGRVISALAELSTGKGKKDAVVPFRDSVLTWLLKDALGGNSRTAIIATISPADVNYDETLSTLRYADSAKRIKTHAIVNEDPNAKLIRELKEELANLRAKLTGNPEVDGTFDPSLPPEKQFVMIRKSDGTLVRVSKAEIAEQLAASEKLMKEVNQTWEEKLAKTEAIQKERESALEALGISVEKGLIGFHSPRVPHLVNLSDDPLLAECLVYNLKPGATTTVGNMDSEANIKLSGANILSNHCRFENVDNVVTLYPSEGSLVMVNGLRLTEPKRLRSGFRVILGDFHFFRFNNPHEAKADRLRLRHSTQLSLSSSPYVPNSPASGSDRGDVSRTASPAPLSRSRAESPTPFVPFSADRDDSEWAMARREAALAMIGPDSNVDMLNDDELDQLMMSLQKHKQLRKPRPESRLTEIDDDEESERSSNTQLGKHDSIATMESLDYDTNLSSWSSPPGSQAPFAQLKMDLEQQLEQQKSEYEEKLTAATLANVEVAELRKEKEEMQEMLAKAKAEAERLLRAQAEEFESRVKGIAKATGYLSDQEKKVAAGVIKKWKSYRASNAVDTLLQYAGMLKEAQVLSCTLGKKVAYQFGMITHEPFPVSQYEMPVEITDEPDDLLIYEKKPSIVVKVLDFNTNRIYFWSLSKFKNRLRIMRSQRDHMTPLVGQDSPKTDPFVDQQPPQFALVGMTDVPLYAVSQQRSQRFKLDVYSPHTFNIVAEIDVSLISDPAITGNGHSFDVHLHSVQGFNAFIGSDFHIQVDLTKANLSTEDRNIFVSKKRSLSTGSTLKYDQRFTVDCPMPIHDVGNGSSRTLRFEIFVKPSTVFLESLKSWDELRIQDEASKFDEAFGGGLITGNS